jgi:hypothetical protein
MCLTPLDPTSPWLDSLSTITVSTRSPRAPPAGLTARERVARTMIGYPRSMRTAKSLGLGDRISIEILRVLRRSTAKEYPDHCGGPMRNVPKWIGVTGKIVEGEKHLAHLKKAFQDGRGQRKPK